MPGLRPKRDPNVPKRVVERPSQLPVGPRVVLRRPRKWRFGACTQDVDRPLGTTCRSGGS